MNETLIIVGELFIVFASAAALWLGILANLRLDKIDEKLK